MQESKSYKADLVIPCYNEEEVLPLTIPKIVDYFSKLVDNDGNDLVSFRLILVDDGSTDNTWSLIKDFSQSYPQVVGLKLSRNFGHQSAMLAGLSHSDGDVMITMDADLQDDITAIDKMLAAYEGGSDMALGVRNDRSTDTAGKRTSANAYYRLLSLLGVNTIENHADFRLMSRRALDALLAHQEVNLFFRGLIPRLGFLVTLVPYQRQARLAGETKYTLRKMLVLAIDGITSFSTAPLRLIALSGVLVFVLAAVLGVIFILQKLTAPETTVPGWASTVLPLLFLGGIQMISLGVIGEYIGKIYMEVKRRPRFIVDRTTLQDHPLARGAAD